MESANEAFTIMLIIANVIFSWKGFSNKTFFERYLFNTGRILGGREYIRVLTSGFLHANIGHLMFNMIALYSFSVGVGTVFGFGAYLVVYFGSLFAGNLMALYIHRNDPGYRAVGASGAVCGVIYSSVIMFPGSAISILFLPFAIPSWLFGILFIFVSVYGIRSGLGNIGHEAHLGGAMSGVVISVMIKPSLLAAQPLLIAGLLSLTGAFLYLMVKRPDLLRIKGPGSRWKNGR
ncbi:MAG: rhomboid family intramembrane serine protease [Bacteroidales bacterium]|nr:rhomboid family intramembrane serine protease [Candidatus Latescibacterota bacterium]